MTNVKSQVDHRTSDLELLKSGNFADVTVTCGAKTWKLHKLILCSRSKFFKKALTGGYQEAADRVVNIEEQEPEASDLVIRYIYGGTATIDMVTATANKPVVTFCVDVYRAAKLLQLESPQILFVVKQHLGDYLDHRLKWMCTRGNVHPDVKDESTLLWINDLVYGIGEAYRWNTVTLKEIFMEFVWVGRQHFLGDSWIGIKLRLDQIQGFIDDMLRRCAISPWRENSVWAPREQHGPKSYGCVRCSMGIKYQAPENSESVGQLWDPFNLTADHLVCREWCRKCAALDRIPWRAAKHK